MNSKRFEYLNKDVPFLKKDITFRLFFALLYFTIFCWQFTSVIISNINKNFNLGMIVSSAFVLITCLLFSALSLLYAFKSMKVLSIVRKNGKCVSSVEILFNTDKKGFIKLYSIITEILSIVCSIVLLCSIIYSALQYSYLSSISYYLPLLATICLCGYYSSYHINTEIATVKNVIMYHSAY